MNETDLFRTVEEAAHRQRARNLRQVLNHDANKVPAFGTPFQKNGMAALRHAGMTGYILKNGTMRASVLVKSPAGGFTEEWVSLATQRGLVRHLANPAAV